MNKTLISTLMICGAGFAFSDLAEISEYEGSMSIGSSKTYGFDMELEEMIYDSMELVAQASCDDINEMIELLNDEAVDYNLTVEMDGIFAVDVSIKASDQDEEGYETVWAMVDANVEFTDKIFIHIGEIMQHCYE